MIPSTFPILTHLPFPGALDIRKGASAQAARGAPTPAQGAPTPAQGAPTPAEEVRRARAPAAAVDRAAAAAVCPG